MVPQNRSREVALLRDIVRATGISILVAILILLMAGIV